MVLPLLALAGVASTVVGAAQANKAAKASSKAATNAAQLQLKGTREQIAANERMVDRVFKETAPQRQIGLDALKALETNAATAFNPTGFDASPGYQFRLDQGQNALESMAAARGMRMSGNALKDFMKFNQGMASDEYGNWWNRGYNKASMNANQLGNLAQMGLGAQGKAIGALQTGAAQTGAAISSGYSGAGNAMMAAGRARASGYINFNNALQGGLQNMAGLIGDYKAGYFN